ncbi:MAG: MaoC family dehydratase N-terminal domain-containing protein [Burkholderiales bacterium]|nr:MaoC family dehydratase N-terminal domain-containing protein [Burkholderiales bacterium]
MSGELPLYDWERAAAGHEASPVTVEITVDSIRRYASALRDDNPAFDPASGRPLGVPPVLVRVYAPLRRRELVAEQGARYPEHPTPAVRWHCRVLRPLHAGERITSVTRVCDKYLRNGRHFLEWEVQARRDAHTVAVFRYVNLWDRGRPEDRHR